MTKAKLFATKLRAARIDHHDSIDQMEMLITILNSVEPTAMFDLNADFGLMVIFSDGTRTNIFGQGGANALVDTADL